jgi:prepilin-type N-terminal cleavage/methylation domain-containing protein
VIRRAPRGFSLAELSVVLLILAIAATAVTARYGGRLRGAEFEDVLDEMEAFDALTRTYARRHDRALRVMVHLSGGRIERIDETTDDEVGTRLVLPGTCRIAELRLAGERARLGQAGLHVTSRGIAPTYAMRIDGPNGRRAWLVFAGLTGEVFRSEDEETVHAILEAAEARPDAG